MSHREDLLAAARELMTTKGYGATTARDLVAASGTNLASIGYHFGSKEALLNEALGGLLEEWTATLGDAAFAAPEASPLERMAQSWVAMLDSFAEVRPLLVAFIEAFAQSERSPELRAQLARHYEACRRQVAEMVRAALGEDSEADVEVVASFLVAVSDGLMLQWLLDPERTPGGEELVGALGQALMEATAQ